MLCRAHIFSISAKADDKVEQNVKNGKLLLQGRFIQQGHFIFWPPHNHLKLPAYGEKEGTFDEIKENRHFPSYESLKVMAKEAGFEVSDEKASDLTKTVRGYISPKIDKKLYGINRENYKLLKDDFKEWKQEGVLPFEPNSLRVPRPMYSCVLEKTPS